MFRTRSERADTDISEVPDSGARIPALKGPVIIYGLVILLFQVLPQGLIGIESMLWSVLYTRVGYVALSLKEHPSLTTISGGVAEGILEDTARMTIIVSPKRLREWPCDTIFLVCSSAVSGEIIDIVTRGMKSTLSGTSSLRMSKSGQIPQSSANRMTSGVESPPGR